MGHGVRRRPQNLSKRSEPPSAPWASSSSRIRNLRNWFRAAQARAMLEAAWSSESVANARRNALALSSRGTPLRVVTSPQQGVQPPESTRGQNVPQRLQCCSLKADTLSTSGLVAGALLLPVTSGRGEAGCCVGAEPSLRTLSWEFEHLGDAKRLSLTQTFIRGLCDPVLADSPVQLRSQSHVSVGRILRALSALDGILSRPRQAVSQSSTPPAPSPRPSPLSCLVDRRRRKAQFHPGGVSPLWLGVYRGNLPLPRATP